MSGDRRSGDPADAVDPEPSAPDPPAPPLRLVEGHVSIDDLDAFLASLDAIADETGAVIQAFDAALVVSDAHLREATRLAARAIARRETVARDPGVEILLYAAGRRQIDRALELGVSAGEQRTVVLVADLGDVPGTDRPTADLDAAAAAIERIVGSADHDGDIDEGRPPTGDNNGTRAFDEERVRAYYGITDRELAATAGDVADVVRERVALLDVEK